MLAFMAQLLDIIKHMFYYIKYVGSERTPLLDIIKLDLLDPTFYNYKNHI